MSGSLQIRGDIGKWVATTANGPLGVGQSQFSFSMFLEWIAFTPATQSSFVFGLTSVLGFDMNFGGSSSLQKLEIKGANSTLSYFNTLSLGRANHFAGVLNATGTSKLYFNGAVVATGVNIGATSASTSAVEIGWGSPGSANFLISDAAAWNGTALTDANIIALRDRSTTPESLSATSHWTLQGTAETNPVASTGGLADQIGSNHLSVIPGSGGATTNAIYSATDLIYLPPIQIASAYVARSGSIVVFLIETNPALGAASMSPVTSVNASPSISINGTPVDSSYLRNAYWPSISHSCPFVAFLIPTVGPTDVVTYTTTDSWVVSAAGACSPDSGTCGNYTGSYEPVLWNYSPFGPHTTNRMKLGFNVIDGGNEWDMQKDAIHRSGVQPPYNWSHAATSTDDGEPLTIDSTASCSTNVWQSNDANAIDPKGWPTPVGVWTLYGDETAPDTPMVPSLSSFTSPGSVSVLSSTPGTRSGSPPVECNKQWQWTATASTNPAAYYLSIIVKLTAPLPHSSSTYPVTLKNLRLLPPGETLTTTPGVSASDVIVKMASSASGKPPVLFRHLIGQDGATNYAIPSDYPPVDLFSYGQQPLRQANDWPTNAPTFSGNRVMPIHAVQPYDPIGGNRKVYFAQQYGRCVASTDYPLYPYEWVPADHGLDYDWWFPNKANTYLSTIECICADSSGNPIPHNLQSGQFVNLTTGTINLINAAGTGTVTLNNNTTIIFVTSDHTFMTFNIGVAPTLTNAFRMGNVNGFQVIDKTASYITAPQPPIEAYAGSGAAGIGIYVTINHCLNDDGVRMFAQRLHDGCPRGTKVYVQFSNEILIPNYQQFWLDAMMSLQGFSDLPSTVIQRGHEMHEIFADVFSDDPDAVVRLFQPFTFSAGQTLQGLTYAQANGIKVDRIAIAPYLNLDDCPEFAMGAAQLCADNPDSIANGFGVADYGGGTYSLRSTQQIMPMAGWHDVLRYFWKYNQEWNGPNSPFALHAAARDGSGYGQGDGITTFKYPPPKLIGYEGGICVIVPAGVSHTKKIIRAGLTQDVMYHPSMYDTATTILQTIEQPGPTGSEGLAEFALVALNLYVSFGGSAYVCADGSDGLFTQAWQTYGFQGQPSGAGLSNKYWSTTVGGDGGSHGPDNESVEALAMQDWIENTPLEGMEEVVSFTVRPGRIPPHHLLPITLFLTGTGTSWTADSVIVVTNSLTGTTAVAAGTWTAISATMATLQVTTDRGVGTWRLTIDGIDSSPLRVATGIKWFSGMNRRAPLRARA